MFFYTRGKYNRPEIKLEIYRVDNKAKKTTWEIFRKYHYLNTELHPACEQYIGIVNGELACHTGIIQMPMRKGTKRVHRLVVLPDYQGIGIGTKFIKAVAKMVAERGYDVNLTTTTPALVNSLIKDDEWILYRFGRSKSSLEMFEKYGYKKNTHLKKCQSNHRVTYSFYLRK